MCLIYLMLLTVLSCCLFRNVSSTLVVVLWCAWNHEEFHIQGAADYKSPVSNSASPINLGYN